MWRARNPNNARIVTPPAKRHYGGKRRKPDIPIWQTPLYQSAAKSPATAAQIAELLRLGVSKGRLPRTILGAAHVLAQKRIKTEFGELP